MTTSTNSVLAQDAVNTAEALMPILIQALEAGLKTNSSENAVIAMAATIIPPLIQQFGLNSSQIAQLMSVLRTNINAEQVVFNQEAASRGIPVEATITATTSTASTTAAPEAAVTTTAPSTTSATEPAASAPTEATTATAETSASGATANPTPAAS